MYILYGGKLTRTVGPQMVLHEGDLAYELREIDIMRDEHRRPEFLAINPAGYVPALITPEGQVLHEAAAIMLYLADRHGLDDLAPAPDAPERGLFYSKLFLLTNDVQPAMKRYYFPHRYSTDDADTPRIKARARLQERWTLTDIDYKTGGPARYTEVGETGQRLGFITPLTHNFCESCNRVRLTCTGMLYMCLGQDDSADLRAPLRASESDDALIDAIHEAIGRKPKGHDFVIDRRHDRPAVIRHMSLTGG